MIREALEILKEDERTDYCLKVDSRTQYHDRNLEMPLVCLRGFVYAKISREYISIPLDIRKQIYGILHWCKELKGKHTRQRKV